MRGLEYEMRTYFDALVIRYCEIAGIDRISLKFAPTPFIDEAKDPSGVVAQEPKMGGSSSGRQTVADPELPEEATLEGPAARTRLQRKQNRTATLAAAKNKAKPKAGSGFEGVAGELNRNAASIGMGALYGARLARYDLLRAIQRLAEKFHAWSPLETKKLHRLVEFINSTLDYRQYAFIGDDWADLELAIFVDADLASDKGDYKSTSGALLVLIGPNTIFPIYPFRK